MKYFESDKISWDVDQCVLSQPGGEEEERGRERKENDRDQYASNIQLC